MSDDLQFYSKALGVLTGPTRRMRIVSALANIGYYLGICGMLGFLVAQGLDHTPPIEVLSTTVVTPVVEPGGRLKVRYDLNRLRTCSTDKSWAIIDGQDEVRWFGPVHIPAPGPVGHETNTYETRVPEDAAPGHARLRISLSWSCANNYLQKVMPITENLPDVPFEIAPKK